MREAEPGRVEELALEPELAGAAVDPVAGHRKPDLREVDADLVRPPGLEPHAQQRVARQLLGDLEVGHGVARRRGVERVLRPVAPVAADRSLDPAGARARAAHDERQVLPLELVRAHQLLEAPVRLGRAGDDEQPRGVPVEPVDDPGPVRLLAARGLVRQQAVDERAGRDGRAPGGRRARPACRRRAGARPRRRSAARAPPARARCAARRAPRRSAPPRPPAGGSSGARARRPGRRRSRAHARRRHGSRARAAPRGNGRAACPRRRQERAAGASAPLARPRAAVRSASTSVPRTIATPITMKLSARLNAGHQRM